MTSFTFPVAVLRTRYGKGASSVEQIQRGEVEPADLLPFEEAFGGEFASDAHFVGYAPIGAEAGAPFCRLNKPVLGELRESGVEIETRLLAFDFDLPGHREWREEDVEVVIAQLKAAEAQEPLLGQWAVWYTTRHGWRHVYVLEEPLPPEKAEGVHRALIARFSAAGLSEYIDMACHDWTRLMRLPKVHREHVGPTHLEAFWSLHFQDRRIDGARIPPLIGSPALRQFAPIRPVDRTRRPDSEKAKDLLYALTETGRATKTEWHKRALLRLKNREVLEYIKGEKKVEEGQKGRNVRLQELIGSSVGLLYYVAGTSPELIYALWVDSLNGLTERTGDDSGRDWHDIAWDMICRCWEKEDSQARAKAAALLETQAKAGKLTEIILEGVRSWARSVPALWQDDSEALRWLDQHLLATDGGATYHVMRPDGFYDPNPINATNIPARVRELGMEGVLPVERQELVNGVPVVRPIPIAQIIARHTTVFHHRVGIAQSPGTYIRDIGTDAATLCFRMFGRRTDLIPAWDPDVDMWLRQMFAAHYDDVIHWIGHALAVEDGPICALSINGPPGVGKALFVRGLAESFDTQTVASAKELTGRFQSNVLKSPFLVVNEGLPRGGRDGVYDPADNFRALMSGDPVTVELKGRGLFEVHNPMRIIITANNDEVLRSLYRHRNLSEFDRQALAARVLHCNLTTSGSDWLKMKGGLAFTGRQGRRWIAGGSGAPSDYVLARHFLWLWKNRQKVAFGSRWLVEGNANAAILDDMALGSGNAPEIIETLINALNQATPVDGIKVVPEGIFCTIQGVSSFYQKLLRTHPGWDRIKTHEVISVLRSICEPGWEGKQAWVAKDRRRWWKINESLLLKHVEKYGHACDALTRRVDSTHQVGTA